ncbi:hypothetical protein ACFSC6_17185 [Rufibacter sediminis]|uniref:Uncharacterized protein n=1 Tax=Rufibacter sediminis TaxID=2762756 RepID=A0ABR6VV14_9BACT|nr:hypothetical protein [Rufibacter sediminis]MBC3541015.1 hypothetical protein [Rufibacter sediminis]
MLDQDLKNLWQNARPQDQIHLNQHLLLQEVSQEAKTVDQKIRQRDRTEIAVALIMIPLFGLVAWRLPFPLTKLGAALVIPWCLLVIYQLKRARRHSVQNFSTPLVHYLHQYRRYLQDQIQLLKGVLFWYMLPFSVCLVLYFMGFSSSPAGLAMYVTFIVVMNVLIYFNNRNALKQDLEPLLEKVDRTIASLEKAE